MLLNPPRGKPQHFLDMTHPTLRRDCAAFVAHFPRPNAAWSSVPTAYYKGGYTVTTPSAPVRHWQALVNNGGRIQFDTQEGACLRMNEGGASADDSIRSESNLAIVNQNGGGTWPRAMAVRVRAYGYMSQGSAWNPIFSFGNVRFAWQVHSNNQFAYNDGAINGTGITANDGLWHTLVQTDDGTTCKCYVDGVETNSFSSKTYASSNVYRFGLGGSANNRNCDCLISWAGYWNRPLSIGEVHLLSQPNVAQQLYITGPRLPVFEEAAGGGVTVAVTGEAITGAQGSVGVSGEAAVSATGQAITSAQGSVTVQIGGDVAVSVTGQEITSAQGSVSVGIPASVSATGQSMSSAFGTVTTTGATTVTPIGQAITVGQGAAIAIVPSATVAVEGQSMGLSVGAVSVTALGTGWTEQAQSTSSWSEQSEAGGTWNIQ